MSAQSSPTDDNVFRRFEQAADQAVVGGMIESWRALPTTAEGWQLEALIRGRSPFYDHIVAIHLTFDVLAPQRFPQLFVPMQVSHFLISEIGTLSELAVYEFKQAWKQQIRRQESDSELAALLALLRALQGLFNEALVINFPDEVIIELLEDHPCDCRCPAFPITFDEYKTQLTAGAQQEFLDNFRAMQAQRAIESFEHSGRTNLAKRQVIQQYLDYGPHCRELYFSYNRHDDEQQANLRRTMDQRGWLDPVWSSGGLIPELKEEVENVYSFPLFSEEFCRLLMEELARFRSSGLPAGQPNSMNNYGLILDDIGLEGFFRCLIEVYLQPIAAKLFPVAGAVLDSQHVFVVQYAPDADVNLDMHTDDCEVTFNVNLESSFSGSSLLFCGLGGTPDQRRHSLTYQHHLGRCVVHLGSHRHGAAPIMSGSRTNLIIWCRSSAYRRQGFHLRDRQLLEGHLDQVCLSRTHDPDFELHTGQHHHEQHLDHEHDHHVHDDEHCHDDHSQC